MKYLLDTNIIIYAVNHRSEKLIDHFKSVPSSSIVIPSIVVAEIEYGLQKSKDYFENRVKYASFLDAFEIIDFDERASIAYGNIRADLERRGQLIGPNDMLIASIAATEECVLVTNNVKEFSRIDFLKIEDWTI